MAEILKVAGSLACCFHKCDTEEEREIQRFGVWSTPTDTAAAQINFFGKEATTPHVREDPLDAGSVRRTEGYEMVAAVAVITSLNLHKTDT